MLLITTMVVSPHPIKSGGKKTFDPVMSFSASIIYCDVVRLTKGGALAQREGR